MRYEKNLFYTYLAQTSTSPLALEISSAKGSILKDANGKEYIDFISGISVSNLGHGNSKIVKAVKTQVDKYMHLMVYGEYVQTPQVLLAEKLCSLLPSHLNTVYYVNSGSEAIEGALKLAKRFTGRHEIISFKNAYHGSTHGALSIMGNETLKQAFRPLLPGIKQINYNDFNDLAYITEKTACVVVEVIQAEGGIIMPENDYLSALQNKCREVGALLIVDEIQTAMGRTGKMFGFEHFNIQPDIITLAKAFGGGMPLGAFVASKEMMSVLSNKPTLGHITTFGGHPVSCAAALAGLEELIFHKWHEKALAKGKHIVKKLTFKEFPISGKGLFLSIDFKSAKYNMKIIDMCIKNGLITDWFLFADNKLRIAPPLTISYPLINKACEIIKQAVKDAV